MADSVTGPSSDSISRLAEHLPGIVVRYDLGCRRTYVNRAYEQATGNAAGDVIGTTVDSGWIADMPAAEFSAHLERTLKTGDVQQFCLRATTRSGSKVYNQVTLLAERDDDGKIVGAVGFSYDITGLVKTQETLRDSEAKYRTLIESANDGISVQELGEGGVSSPFIEVNDALCQRLGYTREELLQLGPADITHPDHRDGLLDILPRLIQAGTSLFESVQHAKDGRSIPVEVSLRLLPLQGRQLVFAIARDISKRKRAEEELLRANRYLRTLSRCKEALIHATDEIQLLEEICRITVTSGQFPFAWIAYQAEDRHLRVAASYGARAEPCFVVETILQQDEKAYVHPAVRAIETRAMQVLQDIATSEAPPRWKAGAHRCGFGSAISLPLLVGDEVIGAFNLFGVRAGDFDPLSTARLSELAADVAYGIHVLRGRRERELTMARLHGSMRSTIQALSSTVELRDPYTAGHQRQVARLAATVARQLGYDEERVEVVYLAGLIHDIGKIAVPSEILSRPGRLTESEMRLIRTHSEAGYGILKSVDFPWPLADIVRQHHERLDGSGYPLGLEGAMILPEARILAVCDVLEAMTSHRPYRSALSVEVAMAEIARRRETWFEPEVVDACTEVLRCGFAFDRDTVRQVP